MLLAPQPDESNLSAFSQRDLAMERYSLKKFHKESQRKVMETSKIYRKFLYARNFLDTNLINLEFLLAATLPLNYKLTPDEDHVLEESRRSCLNFGSSDFNLIYHSRVNLTKSPDKEFDYQTILPILLKYKNDSKPTDWFEDMPPRLQQFVGYIIKMRKFFMNKFVLLKPYESQREHHLYRIWQKNNVLLADINELNAKIMAIEETMKKKRIQHAATKDSIDEKVNEEKLLNDVANDRVEKRFYGQYLKQCGPKRNELQVLADNVKQAIFDYKAIKLQDVLKGRKLMKELYKREANLAMIIKKFDMKMVPLVLTMDEIRPKYEELMALYTDLREKTQAQIPIHNELQEKKSFIKYIPLIYHLMKERAARVIQRSFREYLVKQAVKMGGKSKKKGRKGRSRSKTKKPAAGSPRKPSKSKSKSPAKPKSKSKSPAKPKSKSKSPAKPRSKSKSPAKPKSKSKSPKPKSKSPGAKAKKPKKAKVKTQDESGAEGATPKSKKRAGSKGKRTRTPKKKVPQDKIQLEGNENQTGRMINASAEERIEVYRRSTLITPEGQEVEEKPNLPKETPIIHKPPPSEKVRSSHRISKNPRASKPKTKTGITFKFVKSAGSKESFKLAVTKTVSKISARRLTGYNKDIPADDDNVSDWQEYRKSALKKQNAIPRKSKQKSIPRDSLIMKSRTSSRKSSTRKSIRKSAVKAKISEEKPMVIWSRADFAD